jgi:hypothetical protein
VSLSVHGMAVPDLADPVQAQRRRTISGRIKMLLVLLICAAPVIASYTAFYVLRSRKGAPTTAPDPAHAQPADLALRGWTARRCRGFACVASGCWWHWGRPPAPMPASGACTCSASCVRCWAATSHRLDKVWLVTDAARCPHLAAHRCLAGPAG